MVQSREGYTGIIPGEKTELLKKMKCKTCKKKISFPYDILKLCPDCTPKPLRNWHKTKDGNTVDKAYEGCLDYYRRDEITGDKTCHWSCIDGECCEESKGLPCSMIRYAPGMKSDKIRYIYFKISDSEKERIEKGIGCNRRYQEGTI